MNDWVKAAVIFPGYLVAAPALGAWLSRARWRERAALCLMVSMPSWAPSKLTLMLGSVEWYRGHTKGFEASLIELVAVALMVCAARTRGRDFRWLPPGGWLYLAYCGLSGLSIFPAANTVFALMAAVKFTMVVLIFIAAFLAFRDDEDLRWVLRTLAFALMLQALVALKMRFLDGRWQVHGWFEHQNPMAMWAYLCALPLLSVALSPATSRRDTGLHLAGVGAAALLILLTVSRASLAAFAVGAAAVIALAALRGLSPKLVGIAALGALAALAASMLALNSLRARFQEVAESNVEQDLRAVLIDQSRAMLHDHPCGVGWNNFGIANSLPQGAYAQILMDWDESRGFSIYDENYYANPLTESLYWLLLAETGYLGFASFILFLVATLWWGLRSMLAFWRSPAGYFVAGLLVALTLTYLHGTVERVLTQTKNLSMWLILLGLLARIEQCRRDGRELKEAMPCTTEEHRE